MIIILSILNLDLFKGIPYGNIFSGSQSLFWFIYLFFIASYIRLYEPLKHVKYFGLYFISLCLLLTVLFAINIYIHYEFLGQKTVYNFIINYNNATSEDIKSLMEYVQKKVKEEYNIDLIREQELINWE